MKLRFLLLSAMLCLPMACLAEEAAGPATATTPDELKTSIRDRSQAVFDAVFETCDLTALRALIADDMEFYHDKGGVVARSGGEFIDVVDKRCADRKKPGYRSRRELVETSLEVYSIPGYGAMEVGTHRFYERRDDGPESLTGIAKFAHVWQQVNGEWKLSRVMSYAHGPAP
ncbi:nuclear transport factor 2 family protein [Pseudoxanthomonas sp. UTMC 1351]|uniref:nuclear transport factor 2 family protein n=1 Tax=Pseudoxanthomonas sp. UTMC 1351 TaxID=2695853 RepID=UPI0034CFD51B